MVERYRLPPLERESKPDVVRVTRDMMRLSKEDLARVIPILQGKAPREEIEGSGIFLSRIVLGHILPFFGI